MASKHEDFLSQHCRVCSKRLGKMKYNCMKYSQILKQFEIDTSFDNTEVHPDSFCNNCYSAAKRSANRVPFQWSPHNETSCFVCDNKCKGGRPKKPVTTSGRPSKLQQHLSSVASAIPRFDLNRVANRHLLNDVTCPSCDLAINRPIEILPCKSLVCCSCCNKLVSLQTSFSCPGCNETHESAVCSFSRPSRIVENMLNEMVVECEKCCEKIKLALIEKECAYHGNDSSHMLEDVLNQSLEVEPTKLEKRAAVNLMTRMLHQGDDMVVTLSTGGRVRQLL